MALDQIQPPPPVPAPTPEMPAGAEDPIRWPYSRRIYAVRLLWLIVWKTLWRVCWHRIPILRTLILKCFGAKIAGRISIFGSARVEMPWSLSIGENVSIGQRVHLYNLGGLSIGSNTFLSQDVYICGGTHDFTTLAYPLIRKKITIGNYVWIAAGAFIGPGVTIGDGAVVGARAVVMKDVPPWTVVAGHPAKVIKPRVLRHALPAAGAPSPGTSQTGSSNDRPLRILHLLTCSDAGGLSRYVFDLCTAMHAQGHQVAVAGDRGPWHHLFENAPWPWIDLPLNGNALDVWRGSRKLRQYLKTHPVDVIHSHYRRTNFAGRWARRGNIPLLYTLHLSHMPLPRPRWLFDDFGDHVHVASADAGVWLRKQGRVSPDRISIIPHGIDTERFSLRTEADRAAARADLDLSPTERVAAYVGRFDDPKNVDWLLDLTRQATETKILLVGEGPHESRLRQRMVAEHLQDRVRMLSTREPLQIYQATDALLLPSSREGFSLVCAEAMSVGVPVLRTRTSGASELIVENVTGRSTPIDHDAFIAAAMEFLSDGEALKRMGQAAADHIRRHFTFERQVRETIQLYRELLS